MKPQVSQRAKIALTGFVCAFPAFLIFDYGSSWLYDRTVVSYEDGFSSYLLREMIGLYVFTAAVAFVAALIYRPTCRVGIYCGVTGALMFRLIDLWVYSLLSNRWFEYRGLFTPLLSAVLIGVLFGFLAVSRQFRKQKPPIKSCVATGDNVAS